MRVFEPGDIRDGASRHVYGPCDDHDSVSMHALPPCGLQDGDYEVWRSNAVCAGGILADCEMIPGVRFFCNDRCGNVFF
jgi:hypothetical protein